MKFSAALFSAAVLATSALAAPLTAERQARHAEHQDGSRTNRKTNPPTQKQNGSHHEQYSQNWAGAALVGTGYTGTSARFTVPTPKMPAGGSASKMYCASAWVGIDGDTCQTAILQTGVDFCVKNGAVSYSAWYEWYPNFAYDFKGFTISAGDVIQLSVHATSSMTGTATVDNVSTGKSVTHTFTLLGGVQPPLCEQNAEWIVEDFQQGASLVPFANFGSVTFSNAQAIHHGSPVGPSGATLVDIKQSGKILTHSSYTSNSVTVNYIG